ncbi:hypothetical protein [Streptomyces echinatus]|uniref:hypothetical protein n=1 Tax=Streptomyces echinatus TaxID=67293 RepID=UPI0037BC1FBD
MPDRTSGPGDARRQAPRPAGQDVPADERTTARDAWAPGDAAPGRAVPREPRPEERLPGEPGAGGTAGRLPGSAGPGREGLTGDDRAPEPTPQPPPGPAGVPEPAHPGGPGAGQWHGTEGLRPGTEDLGPGVDAGFTASHRTERAAHAEEGWMPDNGLGAPAPGGTAQREAGTTDAPAPDTWPAAPGGAGAPGGMPLSGGTAAPAGGLAPGAALPSDAASPPQETPLSGTGAPLLGQEETERWERRLREAAVGFVDEPRVAVEQADRTLEEIAARFTEAVTRRRRTLRMSWEADEGPGPGAESDTEQLRLALRDYRELAGRLLHG